MTRSSPAAQLLDERPQRGEVVRIVGIAHDDEAAASGVDARSQCVAIAPPRDVNDPGTMLSGDLLRAIGAAVVGDDHLAAHAQLLEGPKRLVDTPPDGSRFVQARHDDRDFKLLDDRFRRITDPRSPSDAHTESPLRPMPRTRFPWPQGALPISRYRTRRQGCAGRDVEVGTLVDQGTGRQPGRPSRSHCTFGPRRIRVFRPSRERTVQ